MKFLIYVFLFLSLIFIIGFYAQQQTAPSGDVGGGGGPLSCSASMYLTSTGKDNCIIKATINANYCNNKSYEIKDTSCYGEIVGSSFSKSCNWTVSVGNYSYNLYIDNQLKQTISIICKSSEKCDDRTPYDSCSSNKPLYCYKGNLINKCSLCGCPESQVCNTTTQICYTPLTCTGSISLSLTPSIVEPNGLIILSVSGLSNCANKIIYFKQDSCSGKQIGSCTLKDSECTYSFNAPNIEGLYTYYACIDKNSDGDFNDSGENSSGVLNISQEIKKEYILNYLNDSYFNYLKSGNILGLQSIIDSYDILDITIPNRNEAIQLFDSKQNDSGCWFEKTNHYVPNTAGILMVYNRSGVKPAKSLDLFFSTIDTWEEVKVDVLKYDSGNYWGGLWGYIMVYIVYKNQAPPWMLEFWDDVNKNFNSWAYDSHQRTHVFMSLYALRLPLPRVNEVVQATLNGQGTDGSWTWSGSKWNLRETVFNIFMLEMIRNQTSINQTLIDSAIAKGIRYIKSCYNTSVIDGKKYGYFYPYLGSTNADAQSTALGILTFLNPQSDVWTRWFTPNVLQNEIIHLDNSLEYLRSRGLGVHDMAEYVISKHYLGTQIPNEQEIINYFDSRQNQTDGSWEDVNTPMFTTSRVLMAYHILNAIPNRSLDAFFEKYDSWPEALNYSRETGSKDLRNIYHITYAWVLYYKTYPTWLDDFFSTVENETYIEWTNSTDSHKRTHILYNYVIARRPFPNLDGIINETLREQLSDGHWSDLCLSKPRPIYCNAIQLALLQQINKLYPNYRTDEIQNSIYKSRQWILSTYNTTTINGIKMGYFGISTSIEDSLMCGIMAAGINGLLNVNVDMSFEDIIP